MKNKRKLDNIQKALSFTPVNISYNPKRVLSGPKNVGYDPFGDFDGDGVKNILDCAPFDSQKDGFFRDLGGAVRTRVKGEVGAAKERILERVSGEKELERRKKIREAEAEGYYEGRLEEAKRHGKEKALIKKKPISKKIEEVTTEIEKFAKKPRKRSKKGAVVGVRTPDVNLQLLGTTPSKKSNKVTKKAKVGILNVKMPDI